MARLLPITVNSTMERDGRTSFRRSQRGPKVGLLNIFAEICDFFAHVFRARSRSPVAALLLGILIGYLISIYSAPLVTRLDPLTKPDTNILPSPLAASALLNEGPISQSTDPYFLPPFNEEHYPIVPSYNVLLEEAEIHLQAQNVIPQSPITPLFIPFTRNHHMIRQTILSYIAAGWPRSQMYLIDNSGTMDANLRGLLSDTNPFHLDYNFYRGRYGINIVRTPTLLSFAQLQNFMLSTAMNKGWTHFYWTHQDVAVLSDEFKRPYKSLYEKILSSLVSLYPKMNSTSAGKEYKRWGIVWYGFDWLSLVNVAAATDKDSGVGAWDTFIPYYHSDCDYYERMRLMGFEILQRHVGEIYDIAEHISGPEYQFFGDGGGKDAGAGTGRNGDGEVGSARYKRLRRELRSLMKVKNLMQQERNTWQDELRGGNDEPWTYNPEGFQIAWWDMARAGRMVFARKWGTLACKPSDVGKGLSDTWNSAGDPYYEDYDDQELDDLGI